MRVIVKCAIILDDYALLLKRKEEDSHGGLWELAGGSVDEGETLTHAVRREVKEETGLTIIPHYLYSEVLQADERPDMKYEVHFYIAFLSDGCNGDLLEFPTEEHEAVTFIHLPTIKDYSYKGFTIDPWTRKALTELSTERANKKEY